MANNRLEQYKQSCLEQIPALENEIKEIENIISSHFANPDDKELEEKYFNYKENSHGSSYMASQWKDILKYKIASLLADALPTEKKYFSQFLYSDVKAYKCVKEFTPNKIGVVRLIAKAVGEPMSNEWEFTMPDYTDDDIIIIRRHKNGKFYTAGDNSCPFICSSEPYEHYDYNF